MPSMLSIPKESEVDALRRINIKDYLNLMGIQYYENNDLIEFPHQKITSGMVFIAKKYLDGGLLFLPIDFSVISTMSAEKAMSYIEDALNHAENDFKNLRIGYLQKA